ncbi:1-phosphofructokinase [Pseudonocardia broussonetiae]|uniref:1-phosphofructokinase n=1 Tax=Pseudonocardia broussonetiae TaxID=2736640 RepID=A0A6M6JHC8_9PSEU|nr:1-phosphofructokinase [Pseudonocardia broussonetiae]QJY45801.1 1-phosphofructokinase [Pseudonocardia broussonetiae]
MIVTVTPNPSLDRTVEVPRLLRGEVHRATSVRLDPGGKGVNVARALTSAGLDTIAVLPCGRAPGGRLTDLLDLHGVRAATVAIDGATRTNITVVEPDGTTTKINELGPVLTDAEVAQLADTVVALAADASWVVTCGSLPAGMPDDFHAEVVRRTRSAGVRVAVDASDAPLRAACAAGPDLIKPNHEELAELVGRPLTSIGDVLDAARGLRAAGVGAVLVSLGAGGALLVDDSGEHHAVSSPVAVRSTVGAGDATLAGFLAAGGAGPDALRQAVAYGAAACRLPGSAMPGPHEIDLHDVRVVGTPDTTLHLTGAAV